MFVFVCISIMGTNTAIKYEINEYCIAQDIQLREISENERYLLEIAKENHEGSIVILKIINIYIIISILTTIYRMIVLYNSDKKNE